MRIKIMFRTSLYFIYYFGLKGMLCEQRAFRLIKLQYRQNKRTSSSDHAF